jgi:fucose permease
MVRWALVSGILASILCAVGPTLHVVLLGYLVSGTVLGAVFPTVLGIGLVRRPHIAGVVAGVLVAFAGIGSSAFGPAIGWTTDVLGFRAGMLLIPIVLAGALLVFHVAWRIRPHNNGSGQNE